MLLREGSVRIPSPCILLCSAFAFKIHAFIIIVFAEARGSDRINIPPWLVVTRLLFTQKPRNSGTAPCLGCGTPPGRATLGQECRGGAARPAGRCGALSEFTSQLGKEAAFAGQKFIPVSSLPCLSAEDSGRAGLLRSCFAD